MKPREDSFKAFLAPARKVSPGGFQRTVLNISGPSPESASLGSSGRWEHLGAFQRIGFKNNDFAWIFMQLLKKYMKTKINRRSLVFEKLHKKIAMQEQWGGKRWYSGASQMTNS